MVKLVLLLYFLSGKEMTVETYMLKEDCSLVIQNLKDVSSMYKADGVIGLCIFDQANPEKDV